MVFRHRQRNTRRLPQNRDFKQPRVDGVGEVGDLFQQLVGLTDLVGGLLEPALGPVDAPVAVVDVPADVSHVVVFEPQPGFFGGVLGFVFGFQGFAVDFGAETEVLLGVGEEVVRAGADQVGAADFGVREGELGVPGGLAGAHELLCFWGEIGLAGEG